MPRTVRVTAPSRLHFGLWSLGGSGRHQFGGVGVMVDRPHLELIVVKDKQFSVAGAEADRVTEYARRWSEFCSLPLPHCRIEIHASIPPHAGLGSGTQLGLAVAAGLSGFCGLSRPSAQALALSVGRGLRSAVGTYGFAYGGLIVEQGKLPDESISPLDCRIDLPDAWRFVLIRPRELTGLAGIDEATAFGSLPSVPQIVTDQLVAEANERLVPAAVTGNFEIFSESLYRYGRLSGECFAARQGGPYNGPLLTRIVEQLRELAHVGVGQSSWGPTIFAVLPSQSAAESLVEQLRLLHVFKNADLTIAAPDNRGARITVGEVDEPRQRR